jgi:hypothetical protein
MSAIHQVLLAGSGAGYQIQNSLRFRASNSAYLSRTSGASPTAQTKVTYSTWMKAVPSLASTNQVTFISSSGNNGLIGWNTASYAGRLFIRSDGANDIQFVGLFRDPSAWGHLVVAIDTTQATSSDRVKVYWNGVAMTYNSGAYPSLNSNTYLNAASTAYRIMQDTVNGWYLDGYLANVYMIDGQALTPSSFGQTDAATGVWVPKSYSGTFGANGFFLQFKDATSTTTIGYDTSGNSNNFTTSGISVTSGVTFDQMTDTPTLNYAVWSPLDTRGGAVPTNANMNPGVGNSQGVRGTFGVTSGKWYWEHTLVTASTDYVVGIGNQNPFGTYVGSNADSVGYFSASGEVRRNASVIFTYGTWNTSGKVVGFALDQDAGTLQIYVDGVSQGSAFSHSLTGTIFPMINFGTGYGTPVAAINFGQRAFAYTPPSGFKALNTQNVTSTAVTLSGSFTGNAAADGPFIWANGNPATLTINGNGVTFGTDADKTAGGFKLRTSSASYNASGTNNWTATAGNRFVQSKRPNNGQVNP